MRASPHDTTVMVSGIALRCRVQGPEGAPWIAFSNSLMTDLSLWECQAASLSERYRVLRYDQRGHGGSAVPDADCRFACLVDDLEALFDHFGIARAAVCGVSMGGVTALGFAARYPQRVAGVAVCDCQGGSSAAGGGAWNERIAVARAGGMAALVEPTIRRWFTPASVAAGGADIDAVRRMIGATPLDGFVRGARALQDYDFRDRPAALRCPALFLAGAEDGALPDALRAMAGAAPDAVFTAVPDAGHLPNVERPAAFDAALAALLARAYPEGAP
ncbi:alpha/beta fold hydrolase [Lichenibacterium minor]|uniref:Alpha/beta fold hydrolase n=1 Tax=Lichenibacterium minor TaxID=2316528 RepID=A0A4V1RU85_9HYPH|nr:alpha/beta fold hydrolase [Lichenibacterium minor]RYC30274.1 alpha/beta fold hydrolase [Lichenibacterium minor]